MGNRAETDSQGAAERAGDLVVELCCQGRAGSARRGEPVTCGVPWRRGLLRHASQVVLTDGQGRQVPVQAKELSCWPDGSLRWVLLDWLADRPVDGQGRYQLRLREDGQPSLGLASRATVRQADGRVWIDTGVAVFELRAGGRFPFESASAGGLPAIDSEQTRLVVEGANGDRCDTTIDSLAVEDDGPIRASARIEGRLVSGKNVLCDLLARLHFFAGSPTVRFVLTLRNPRRASHPGGCWDLGDAGSIFLRNVWLEVALPSDGPAPAVRFSPEIGHPFEEASGDLEIYQDSSGGENWQSTNHLDRRRSVATTFCGYRLRSGAVERTGLRATPAVCMDTSDRSIGTAMPGFWQQFPKAMAATGRKLALGLFPTGSTDAYELQGGEQKTHTFYVAFGPDAVAEPPLDWCRQPTIAHAAPEAYRSAGVVRYLPAGGGQQAAPYDLLVQSAMDGPESFLRKREVIDEYGWRSFGDVYADHENAYAKAPRPIVSHYNNQYDAIYGFGVQFMRSGDVRWLGQMGELASHVVDIDVYHTDRDKSAYSHGMFWHTSHYVPADTGTHRSYPARHTAGGGPNAGHLYTSGLVLHYSMTGDPLSRQTAIELGRYAIESDDGRRTVFRWLDGGPTGVGCESAPGYYGPGRSPANAVNALLDAHLLTNDEAYLTKAEELIRRCIHPEDDPDSLDLLDAENRWFYVVFLQTIGRYLDYKVELGQLDGMCAYARSSLLHYAGWMAEHERPYLDKPESLEYPTETWAAQDIRKSDVFAFAAMHAGPQDRARFLERSEWFFQYSVSTLSAMPTRALTRPVVLLLSNGLTHLYVKEHPDLSLPEPAAAGDFGRPCRFEPQKARAIRRFKYLLAAGTLATLAALGLWVIR